MVTMQLIFIACVAAAEPGATGDVCSGTADDKVYDDSQLLQAGVSVHSTDTTGGTAQVHSAAGPPKLTKVSARAFLTKALETFRVPATRTKLESIIKDCETGSPDPSQANTKKMMTLMPVIQSLMEPTLKEYGFGNKLNDWVSVTMQIQAFAPEDASIAADIGKIMKALQGDFKQLFDGPNI